MYRALARPEVEPETVLRDGLGESLAAQLVAVARRVRVRTVGAAERDKDGRPRPYTTRVEIEPEPIRAADAELVRCLGRLVVCVAGYMRPDSARTGHPGQGARICVSALARRLDRSRREVTRWLAALRVGGVLQSWQPPQNSGAPKGHHSGHCYALFRLPQGVPPALAERLKTWVARHLPSRPRAPTGPAAAPTERGPLSEAAAALAAKLAAGPPPLSR